MYFIWVRNVCLIFILKMKMLIFQNDLFLWLLSWISSWPQNKIGRWNCHHILRTLQTKSYKQRISHVIVHETWVCHSVIKKFYFCEIYNVVITNGLFYDLMTCDSWTFCHIDIVIYFFKNVSLIIWQRLMLKIPPPHPIIIFTFNTVPFEK